MSHQTDDASSRVLSSGQFAFATGIENKYPVIRIGEGDREGQL